MHLTQLCTPSATGNGQTEGVLVSALWSAQTNAQICIVWLCARRSRTACAWGRGDDKWLVPQSYVGEENKTKHPTLDLYELVMFLGVKAGFGWSTAELPSPWILRQERATIRTDKSLTLNSRAVLNNSNFSDILSRGSNGALTSTHKIRAKSHWSTSAHDTSLCQRTHFRKRFISRWLKTVLSPKPCWHEKMATVHILIVLKASVH